MRPILRCSSILALAVVLAVACGGGKAAPSGVNAQDVLSRSATKFGTVKTFHFKLEHQNGFIPIVLGLHLITAEGDVVVPDRVSADLQAKAAGSTTVKVHVIGIGSKTWITNPFTRQYQQVPGDTAVSEIVDPVGLVSALATSVQGAEVAGTGSVDGVDCYHITGTLTSDALTKSLSFAEAGRSLQVETWIGKDDSLPRRALLKGALVADENANVVREINLSKFDAPVDIQPP